MVIAIIAILAAVLMPALARARWQAKNTICINNLFGDMVIGGTSPADPVKALHSPTPNVKTAYITDASHLSRINEYFQFNGKFYQNNVFQDGSVMSVQGDSYDIGATHIRVNSGDLIPNKNP